MQVYLLPRKKRERDRERDGDREQGLAHLIKVVQGAPLPRYGPGQRVVVQIPGGEAGKGKSGTRSEIAYF